MSGFPSLGRRRVSAVFVVTLIGLAQVAPCVAQESPPATAPLASGEVVLPVDLSLPAMFLHADIVVQSVMVGLGLASVVTWTILLAKGSALFAASRRLSGMLRIAEAAHSLAELRQRLGDGKGVAALMVAAVAAEHRHAAGAPHTSVKERVASRLRRLQLRLARQMTRGTGLLATIGATAPFIGLFGTVWGIMNSFIGISKMQTTNLAVVAPGIAEALMATAAGLIAAIPAVVIYNLFARAIGGYRHGLGDLTAAVERLASRELDDRAPPLRIAAE